MIDIKFGDNNDEVTNLQNQLIKLFYSIKADGSYGPKTQSAVQMFQKLNGFNITGNVDDATFNLITNDVLTNASVDKPSFSKISTLHPKIRFEVLHLTKLVNKANVKFRIVQGYRTFAEQDALYAQGRTKPGAIVTKARGGLSNHNYGLAIDFCLLHSDGSISWSLMEDADADGQKDWMEVVNIFKSAGYEWGGNWKNSKDNPHLDKMFNFSIRQLLAKHQNGQVDENGFVII